MTDTDTWLTHVTPKSDTIEEKLDDEFSKAEESRDYDDLHALKDQATFLVELLGKADLNYEYGEKTGKAITTALNSKDKVERWQTEAAINLLQRIWENAPTFYSSVFFSKLPTAKRDIEVVAETKKFLQETIQRLDDSIKLIDPKDNYSWKVVKYLLDRPEQRKIWLEARDVLKAQKKGPPRSPPQKPVIDCNNQNQIIKEERQRQQAITWWALENYKKIWKYISEDLRKDHPEGEWIRRDWGPQLAELANKWARQKKGVTLPRQEEGVTLLHDEIPPGFQKNAKTQWVVLLRHLIYMQERGKLSDSVLGGLVNKDKKAWNIVFGNYALEGSVHSSTYVQCVSDWAKRQLIQNKEPMNLGVITRRMEFQLRRYHDYLLLVRNAFRLRWERDPAKEWRDIQFNPDIETWMRDDAIDLMLQRAIIRNIESCISCGTEATLKCGGCIDNDILYCGSKCQHRDWLTGHKETCQKVHLE
jgi:hypothetical protein